MKPKKVVLTTAEFAVGECILVPTTSSIKSKTDQSELHNVHVVTTVGDNKFYIPAWTNTKDKSYIDACMQ